MNATCLKMAGGQREEQVAERLRKPVSGTVADGMGPIGERRLGLRAEAESQTGQTVRTWTLVACMR
jgi:hypothetical protein